MTDLAATSITRRPRRRLARFAALLTVVVATIAGAAVASPGTAEAASFRNQWAWYDVYTGDRDYELIIYFDAYGYPAQAYADLNNNGTWDASTQLTRSYGAKGWLYDLDERGDWDALITSRGETFSNVGGCGGGGSSGSIVGGGWSYAARTQDGVYGLWWCNASSLLTGRISAPNLTGNMLHTLSTLSKLAPSMHCYNYSPYYWPSTGRCHTTPRA